VHSTHTIEAHDLDHLPSSGGKPGARRILVKLEIHYTPKHGSWLNRAEKELSILSRQCMDRRIPDQEILKKEISVWQEKKKCYCLSHGMAIY
jgi:hypothetical protein